MAIFVYTAKDSLGNTRTGTVEALNQDSALNLLKNQDLVVVSIKVRGTSLSEKFEDLLGVSKEDVTAFTRELSTMLNSGLPLSRAMQISYEQVQNPNFKKILMEIAKDIDSGTSLAGALSRYPNVFDMPYVSLIKAGESSGKLDTIMQRIAAEYEAIRDLESRLRAALIYPVIVLIVMFLVILVLVVYVVPKLTEIFTSLNQQLPWHTQLLVNTSNLLINYWFIFVGLAVIGVILFRSFYLTDAGKIAIYRLLISIPALGKVIKQADISNYLKTLALLVSSGVSITEALQNSAKVTNNPFLTKASLEASSYVEKGNALSDYFRSNKFFDPIIPSMVKIGEETGKIDEMLNRVADNYANDSSYAIKGLSSALEPVILVILGVSVGGIVLSVITPIYSLVGSFSQ
ncbi:type II secretion system F family protein [bacterium]|nr:type II secretion system F family protein [bacterium]NBO36290.1 type II secretion system F family protein [bacterium]